MFSCSFSFTPSLCSLSLLSPPLSLNHSCPLVLGLTFSHVLSLPISLISFSLSYNFLSHLVSHLSVISLTCLSHPIACHSLSVCHSLLCSLSFFIMFSLIHFYFTLFSLVILSLDSSLFFHVILSLICHFILSLIGSM